MKYQKLTSEQKQLNKMIRSLNSEFQKKGITSSLKKTLQQLDRNDKINSII